MQESTNMLHSIPLDSRFGLSHAACEIIENYEGTGRQCSDEEIMRMQIQRDALAKGWQNLQVSGYVYGPQQSPQASISSAQEALIPKLTATLVTISAHEKSE